MDVEEVADELYGLDPSVFVAARTGRVEQAKARKDRDAARALAALRKPTTVGWLVNLLARESPDDVSAVLALGDALRQAQRRLDPTALRELSDQRQRVVRALAERAGRLAAERGRVVGEAALREVAQTLHAAMADPDLARTVERGRVLCAARYSGFGPAVLESVGRGERSAAGAAAARKGSGAVSLGADAREVARAELTAARASAEAAREATDVAEREVSRLDAEAAEIADRMEVLRRDLEHLEQRDAFVRESAHAANAAARSARSDLERARRWESEAEAAVEDGN
ncbi:hypothetical protein DEU38_101493 [Rhodococcus sp. AG1013]|uniref:hypothetical protein n=1 Tax=Rhodococcus sp. AG1013 TaxID=2183996 RepID=UPI000E0A0ABB|nr:hypothetical protein [Rhodococcus sp. AG1013]RDI36013.1 hypothetical protein DEU38_101493 [Rhodococcus sp. AG1013]